MSSAVDHVALAETGALELPRNDLGHVVAEHVAHGVLGADAASYVPLPESSMVSPGRTVPSRTTVAKMPSVGMTQLPTAFLMAQSLWHSLPIWVTSEDRSAPTRKRVPTGRVFSAEAPGVDVLCEGPGGEVHGGSRHAWCPRSPPPGGRPGRCQSPAWASPTMPWRQLEFGFPARGAWRSPFASLMIDGCHDCHSDPSSARIVAAACRRISPAGGCARCACPSAGPCTCRRWSVPPRTDGGKGLHLHPSDAGAGDLSQDLHPAGLLRQGRSVMSTPVRGTGWHMGMSSQQCLAAWMPATWATARTSPFFMLPLPDWRCRVSVEPRGLPRRPAARAEGGGLLRHVHHPGPALFVEMGQFRHGLSLRSRSCPGGVSLPPLGQMVPRRLWHGCPAGWRPPAPPRGGPGGDAPPALWRQGLQLAVRRHPDAAALGAEIAAHGAR